MYLFIFKIIYFLLLFLDKNEDIQSFCVHCNENLDENVNANLNLKYFA